MTDQTTTDDEHVCKPGASVYYCPTSGETESDCHGGFDVCCDRPDLHQSTDEACQQLAERLEAVRATAEAWIRPTMSAPTRTAGEHLLRVLSAEPSNRTDSTAPLPSTEARTRLLQALDATYCQALGHTPEGLLAAYEASRTQTVDQAALRDRIACAIEDAAFCPGERRSLQLADAVLAVLPATPNHDTDTGVTPPPALTEEGRLRARVQVLEEDAERDQGLAATGARCLLRGHQGQIESGHAVIEGHRFALSTKLGLGTGAPWDAIHERVAELRRVADETAATETDTLPSWLHWRFGPHGQPWAEVPDEDKSLWEHQARAVRRAVARGGFKQPTAGARQDGAQP